VNKTAASSAQLAKCILIHAYSRTTAGSQLRENKQILYSLQYLTVGITVFLVINLEQNSKFTGPYKNKVYLTENLRLGSSAEAEIVLNLFLNFE